MCHAHWGGHQVTVLSRDPTRHSARLPQVQLVNTLENVVTPIDAIINLAGKSLLEGRWNKHIKEEIRSSRLQTTRRLYDWIATLAVERRPRRLISASAIGYYGNVGIRLSKNPHHLETISLHNSAATGKTKHYGSVHWVHR